MKSIRNEKGYILVLAMMISLILTIMTAAVMNSSIFEMKLAGNDLLKKQAFFNAESGWNIFATKLVKGEIVDDPNDINWSFTLNESLGDFGSYSVKGFYDVVGGKIVSIAGSPVYVLLSTGYKQESNQIVEVKIVKNPSLEPPSALYAKSPVKIKGSSTYIQGTNACLSGYSKPGIITTTGTIDISGNPVIDGSPPQVTWSDLDIKVGEMVDYFKDYANFKYSFNGNETVSGGDWGSLTGDPTGPLFPVGKSNIVYFDMGSDGTKTIKLSGGSHGAGLLLVRGNLEVNGGFSWYGVILVTGSISYTGGGEKNITGGVVSGDETTMEGLDIGGNARIIYCGDVKKYLEKDLSSLKIKYWVHKF